MREVIISADDFGISDEVNEAVEAAHRNGVLNTTSLMVAAPATADAVRRARALDDLHVGLHVVLVNGRPKLPPERVPLLVDRNGEFATDLAAAGVNFFFRPGVRRQLEAEIRAQFDAFAATGLPLDHVNAQNHMHVHPTVLGIILKVGKEYGLRAVRVPFEPFLPSWRSMRTAMPQRFANAVFLWPWLSLMKQRLRGAGIATNDYVFGMNDTGHMTAERVVQFIAHLPRGVSELYFHPATTRWAESRGMDDYDFAGEYAALVAPSVIEALRGSGARSISYTRLANGAA
ncbi:MAG: hopanoid biosynthesis-associated protein HpnK [Candidatus Eremiobacteraeota bacterium]|nr:hopanoid biosynthesis-associated protein HpnK [Candidatus Eremiobacteraeota bacterium]